MQQKPKKNPTIWKWVDMYTLSDSRYPSTLSPEVLEEAVAVVRYDLKYYQKKRRSLRRGTGAYEYASICIEEMRMFLYTAKKFKG